MTAAPGTWKLAQAALVCLAACVGIRGLPAWAAEDRPLRPGVSIEDRIRGGEKHWFLIEAAAGQFLHVAVEQKGIDVAVVLLAPDGHQLAQSDLQNGAWGPEPIVAVVGEKGAYRLTVSVPGASVALGNYEIRLLALRDPEPADLERAAAETAFRAGETLRLRHTPAARDEAIRTYEQVLPFFEKSGDQYRVALALNTMGLIRAEAGDLRAALSYYDRAIPIFQEIGEQRQEANTVNNAGGAYDVLGEPAKARQRYEQALAWARSANEGVLQAIALNNIGKLYYDQSEWQKALDYYREALTLIRAGGDRRREGVALGNLGNTYTQLGDPETARSYLRMAQAAFEAVGNAVGQANTLNSIGLSWRQEGKLLQALPYFEQTLPIYRQAGDRRREAVSLIFLGVCLGQLGETDRALQSLQQSVALTKTTGDRKAEGVALNSIGGIYIRSGQPRQAEEYASAALAIFRAIGERNAEAATLQVMAQARREAGDLSASREYGAAALATIEAIRGGAGGDELRASYLASNQDAYVFMIDLLMEMHGRDPKAGFDGAALATSERARARSMLEMIAEAGADIREGVDPVLAVRERDISNTLNAKGARLLAASGRNQTQVQALQDEIRTLEQEHADVQLAIRRTSPAYAALVQPQPLTLKQIQSDVLDKDSLLLEYGLGAARSFLWVASKDSISTFELAPREKIERQTELVASLLTARGVFRRMETPPETKKRIAAADAALAAAVRQLSDMVLGPAAGLLGNRRLVVVPDGALQRLPFAVLPLPGKQEPLVVSHEVVMLPSASALAVLRQQVSGRKPASKLLAVFADPVFDAFDPRAGKEGVRQEQPPFAQDSRLLEHLAENGTTKPGDSTAAGRKIPRLPYTAQEADQILRVAGGTTNLRAIGFEASRAAATSGQLSEYRYLHFATHGYLDTERPGLSALVLSQLDDKRNAQDGFLRVNDIYNMRLSADLVVLSACQTGLGKEVRGEGLMGLTRAFLYAGAPRLIVSLWNVNDRATAELMASLYRGMLRQGKSPSAALRDAQLEMRRQKKWESPYYWAAFIQQGEWWTQQ